MFERMLQVPSLPAVRIGAALSIAAVLTTGGANAQLSRSAYRVVGQPDLRQNGMNMVDAGSLDAPLGIALDTRAGATRLYIADTQNARILAWRDTRSYEIGDPPALVLGQLGPQYFAPLGLGTKGLAEPVGLAIAPSTGDLYVADYDNHRVVRFPAPFENPNRIEPDAVYGQPNFSSRNPATASAGSLNHPRAIAFDAEGNLWVCDSGNHRLLRFPASSLNNPSPPSADIVIGQKTFEGATANGGGAVSPSGLDTPTGLAFDAQNNLYVCDFRNGRVLKFPAPLPSGAGFPAATAVWGESGFTVRNIVAASASTMAGPNAVAVSSSRELYVSIPGENRILVFSLDGPSSATIVIGQPDFTTSTSNTGAAPNASAASLAAPADIKLDSAGNLFVADSGNHRVVEIPATSKSANRVWGQTNFASNGANRIKPGSLNLPFRVAVDYSAAPFALYVADTRNNRVLGWRDSARFRNGDPADFVIGQPDLYTGTANTGAQSTLKPTALSLLNPTGVAVDPNDGTLYVADTGNNRVLRYPRPINQSGRIAPAAVIGQPDFTTSDSAAVSASTLNQPVGVAVGSNGSLYVADTGNYRVLQFPSGGASALRVFGQSGMNTAQHPTQASAQTLSAPQGLAVDQASNLYVADSGFNRVLVFPNTDTAPPAGAVAAFVIGQTTFSGTGTSRFKSPSDIAIDSKGRIYVADAGNHRVLAFASLLFLASTDAAPSDALGQPDLIHNTANWNSSDGLATPDALNSPAGVYVDRQDTLYVADAGNHRVLHFLKLAAVANAATMDTSAPVARGSLATLFSVELLDDTTAKATDPSWPRSALNRQIIVNQDIVAPLSYIDPTQINFQVPSLAPLGAQQIAIETADTGELIAGGALLVAVSAPGIFTASASGSGQAAAFNQDLTRNGSTNPAAAGSTITLYGTGQGQVSPALADGVAASEVPLSSTVAVPTADGRSCLTTQPSMCVAIGTSFGVVRYSGLAPGYVGLWQINVTIPQALPSGATSVKVLINGAPSNLVTVWIR